MINVKIVLDRRRIKLDGSYPIKLLLRHKNVIRINTGMTAKESEWTGNEYKSSVPGFRPKNMRLRNLIAETEKALFRIEESRNLSFTSDKEMKDYIERYIKGEKASNLTLSGLFERFISQKNNKGTIGLYEATKRMVDSYTPNISIENINVDWIVGFENNMKRRNCKTNYIGIQLRNIRAVLNYAIDNELTSNYPFRRFRIKKEETEKRSLTVKELQILRDYKVEKHQQKYRDMFMLMFYLIGINAADLFNLPPQKEKVVYHRAKTNKLYEIKIQPEAQEIIDKYQGKKYMLNILESYSNYMDFLHHMNKELKKIGISEQESEKGRKIITPLFPKLSSYWARHTWATIAAELDIPKETIAASLGHSTNEVTDIYIRFDKRKIDEANRKVIDYINKTQTD